MYNASQLAPLMGMSNAAHWHAISTLRRNEQTYREETGNDLTYFQKPSGEWQVEPEHAEAFGAWWRERTSTDHLDAKTTLLIVNAYHAFRSEMEAMGLGETLDRIGIDNPFFERVEPIDE